MTDSRGKTLDTEIKEIELLLEIDEDICKTVNSIEKAKTELVITGYSPDDIILLLDINGVITRGNQAIKDWGLDNSKIFNNISFHKLFHPDCKAPKCHFLTYWILAVEKLKNNVSFEYKIMDNILKRHLLIQYIPLTLTGKTDNKEFAIAYFKDISKKKQTEIDLTLTTNEFNIICKAIPDQYYRINNTGLILDLKGNEISSEIYPFPRIVRNKIYKNLKPEFIDIFKKSIKKVLNENKLVDIEYFYISNERKYFFEARLLPLKTDQIIVINRNITEKKRLMTIAESVNMMDNLGFLFSAIRHEIGNPINAVKMTMSVLRNNIGIFTENKITEYTDRVLSEINRIEYLLNSFKSFNMYEDIKTISIDTNAFFNNLLKLIKQNLKEKNITMDMSINSDTGYIYADPRALHQVLLNIIVNATEAIKNGTNPKITITTKRIGKNVQIKISDNGIGMDKEQVGNLFKPFFTTKYNGTGLGLVIAKKLLTNMNGQIEAESALNVGTTFTVILPGVRNE